MTLRVRWDRFVADFVEYYRYVRDPHGWWAKRRYAEHLKYWPRPAMYEMHRSIVAHPALERRIREKVEAENAVNGLGDLPMRYDMLYEMPVYFSEFATRTPPPGGWTDVTVPQVPRYAA